MAEEVEVSRKRAGHAILWSGIGWYGVYLLTFIFSVITARLLSPAEFGLVAMVYIIVSIADLLVDSGTMAALVRQDDEIELAASTGLALVSVNALVASALIAAASPLVAAFYDQPKLFWICFTMAWLVFISALAIPAEALLQRNFDVKMRKVVVDPLAIIGYGVTAIGGALAGWGVWALVLAQFASFGITTIGYWILARKYFRFRRPTWRMYRTISRYGRGLLHANIAESVEAQAAPTVLGRSLSENAVGLWNAGQRLGQLPLAGTVSIIGSIVFPALSRMASDMTRFRSVAFESLKMNAILVTPLGIFLLVTGTPTVAILFGQQWRDAGVVLEFLGVWAILQGLASIGREIFKALGRSSLVAYGAFLEVAVTLTYLVALWATGHVSLWTVALSKILSSLTLVAVYAVLGSRIGALSGREQWASVRSPLVAGIAQTLVLVAALHYLVPDFDLWATHGLMGVLGSLATLGGLLIGGIAVYGLMIRLVDPAGLRQLIGNMRGTLEARRA